MFLKQYVLVVVAVAAIGLVACGDPLEPVLIPVPDEAREATLTNFRGGDVLQPSAFDVLAAEPVRTDQISAWDFVVEVFGDGTALLWPRSAITEEDLESGLRLADVSFDDLRTAPESGYTTSGPVVAAEGDVLSMRSRRDPAFGSFRCRRYGKTEILSIDVSEGTMTMRHLVNPNCEKRTLVPGAEE